MHGKIKIAELKFEYKEKPESVTLWFFDWHRTFLYVCFVKHYEEVYC